jgi:uncharacterized glyoxalase superfamily protein PhnB
MSETLEAQAAQMEFPPTKGGLVTYLNVDGAIAAAEFYVKAFGAEIAAIMPPDDQGRTMHAHVYVNGSSLMISDFYPEHGHQKVAAQGFTLVIMTTDIDRQYAHAVENGATGVMPPQDMFWGDRYAELKDPYGVSWAMNQPIKA